MPVPHSPPPSPTPHHEQKIQRRRHRLWLGRHGSHRRHQRHLARAGHRRLEFAQAGLRGAVREARLADHGVHRPREMLASKSVQVVDITSYPDQHAQQFIAAAKAGKHIIVEKPLAIEWNDILAMKAAAKSSGAKVCVCFECRYSSQFLATKAVIDGKLIGKLHYGEVDYYHGIGPWYGQYRWNTKQGARRQRAAHRRLPCARCAPALHGRRRRPRSAASPRRAAIPSSRPTNIRRLPRASCVSKMAQSANARRSWTACSLTTSTRISSAARAASSITNFTARNSAG